MHLYQFNEIYYRVTGEYENGIQILFFESEGNDILVYTGGFDLVNKPTQLNLSGFSRLFKDNKTTYRILRLAYKYTYNGEEKDPTYETYVELEGAVIRIGWHFSTVSGQQVENFWLYFKEENRVKYDEFLAVMDSAKEIELTDLRFI